MKRNSKYLVCKWGSGKRNDNVTNCILSLLSCESQRTWVCSLSSVRFPLLHMGCWTVAVSTGLGSGKEERWALPKDIKQTQQAGRSIYAVGWASMLPLARGNLLSPPHSAVPALFCLLFAIYWSTRNRITLTSLLMHRRRERLLFLFFPAAQVQRHPRRGVLAWLD